MDPFDRVLCTALGFAKGSSLLLLAVVVVGEGIEVTETLGMVVSFFGLDMVVSLAGDVCDIEFD